MTEPIKLPPPHGYIYVWDGPYGTHRLTAGQYNGRQCDRAVAYYTEAQVHAAIESDRQARGEPVVELEVVTVNGKYRRVFCKELTKFPVGKHFLYTTPQPQQQETHSLQDSHDDAAVDAFAATMKAKLAKKRVEGRGGWQECSAEYLSELLREHVEKGDPVDVANLAMMLHQNGQRITPVGPVKVPSDDLRTLQNLLSWAEAQICLHEETHRGGAIWEICDQCGAKWADDEGGRPAFEWPNEITDARALLAKYGNRTMTDHSTSPKEANNVPD